MKHNESQVSLAANPEKSNLMNFQYSVIRKGSVMNEEISTLEIRNTCLTLRFGHLIENINYMTVHFKA
jgi:hypothetical protein